MNTLDQFNPVGRSRSISAANLWALLQKDPSKVLVMDTRPTSDFANGHIPHAINRPYPERVCLPSPRAARTTVVYGEDEVDWPELLIGGPDVYCLEGGWYAWLAEGFPIDPPSGSLLAPWQFVDGMDLRLLHCHASENKAIKTRGLEDEGTTTKTKFDRCLE